MNSTSIMKEDQRDIQFELKKFIAGASQNLKSSSPLELTKTALYLLKYLPSARDAVLEYFNILFDQSLERHVAQIRSGGTSEDYNDPILSEIQNVLGSFVSSNPEPWAPIISSWCLELLGQLSSKYQGRIGQANSLHGCLQLWMSCKASRTLVDINTQCLSCLIHFNTETCINSLLDTSVEHSPHFDWVVAHVGSCFPHTVITRVLSCGLKDYCLNEQGPKAPKLSSVVGILGHLAGSHFIDIKKALLSLFQWSLEPNVPGEDRNLTLQKTITVPFLLQLASMSPILHKALCSDVLPALTLDIIHRLSSLTPDWSPYLNGKQGLLSLCVHLVVHCEEGAHHIVQLVLDTVHHREKGLHEIASTFIEMLLKEMEQHMRSNSEPIRFLQSLENNILSLLQHVPSDNQFVHSVVMRLLLLLGRHNTAAHVVILEHCLLLSDVQDLVLLVSSAPLSNAIGLATRRLHTKSVESVEIDPARFWNNLYQLLRWELSDQQVGSRVVTAISKNLTLLTEELESCTHAQNGEKICLLIDNTLSSIMTHAQLDQYLKIARSVICFFFTLLYNEPDAKVQVQVSCSLRQLLSTVCSKSAPARTLALRELIAAALLTPHAKLFGAKEKLQGLTPDEPSLLEDNMKQVVGVMSHSSVFHAGVIGRGPRIIPSSSSLTPPQVTHHEDLILSLLGEICRGEAMGLALYLVEIISPDVMYNGLPWLEEDFCKVTIERDLHIKQFLDRTPLVWSLLVFIARIRPALCTCSVLLRAVTASLLCQWNIARQRRQAPGSDPTLVQCTVRLLEIMSLGQLLPPPLSALYLLVPHIAPQHVVMLLRDCVWSYMRDHVPSPALFTSNVTQDSNVNISWRDPAQSRPPSQYTDTMRFILRRNMAKFGPLYRLLFSHQSEDGM
uniref:Integrator complex subunit 5 n=1 Tax=Cacopsylla melanoneura TaxID=428564 RepID=A0A8D8Q3X9_9HEMI